MDLPSGTNTRRAKLPGGLTPGQSYDSSWDWLGAANMAMDFIKTGFQVVHEALCPFLWDRCWLVTGRVGSL